MSTDCCDKGKILDAECCYDNGKFYMGRLPRCLPRLFTVRFTAPADYTADDVVVVDGKELPVRTPGMAAAASDIFKAGAVIHCDVDLDRELAFFWQGGGNGTEPFVLPNQSYEEQFAGFFDVQGKKVYVKTIDFSYPGTTGANFETTVEHGIQNLDRVIRLEPLWNKANMWNQTLQFIESSTALSIGSIRFQNDRIHLFGARGVVSAYQVRLTVYYTCTDR